MKLSKVFIFIDNLAFKLSKRVFNGISLINNIPRLKKKDHLNAFYQRVDMTYPFSLGYGYYLEDFNKTDKIICGDNK